MQRRKVQVWDGLSRWLLYIPMTYPHSWLVGGFNQPLWKMMEWVSNSWDDDIPNWMEKIKFFFQTTNQLDTFPIIFPISIGCSMIFPGRIQRVGMCVIVPPSVLCQLRIRCVGDGWNTQAWPSPSPMTVLFWFTNGMIYIKIHLSHALIFCSARSGSST